MIGIEIDGHFSATFTDEANGLVVSAAWVNHDDERGTSNLFLIPGLGMVVGNVRQLDQDVDGMNTTWQLFINGEVVSSGMVTDLFNGRLEVLEALRYVLGLRQLEALKA